jgi:hypothetical protein
VNEPESESRLDTPREPPAPPPVFTRRDALALAPTLLILALLYTATLCPTVWWYDSAEFAARATTVHHAHAPGYPSYVLLAHLFTYLGHEPAWGTNFMSALFGLGCVAAAYLLGRLLGVREAFAAVAAFALGTSQVFWANAVMTEVYTPGLCFTLMTLCLLLLGQDPRRWRLVPAAAVVAGVGMGMHMSIATCGLGMVLLAAAAGTPARTWADLARVFTLQGWRTRLKIVAWCVAGLAVGLSVFAILPLIEFNDIFSRRSWIRWGHLITGKVFQVKFADANSKVDFLTRNYEAIAMQLRGPGLVLGLAGLLAALVRRPLCGLALGLAVAGNVWFFWNYRVHDIEVFFLPAVAIAFVLGGYACESAACLIEARLDQARRAVVTPVLATVLALWPLTFVRETYATVDMSEATEARAYAQRVIHELPQGALFVKYNHPEEWKYYAVLLYVQKGLGERGDVRVVTLPNLDELDDKLAAGTPVFAFTNVGRVRQRVDVREEDGWVRVIRTNYKRRRK